MDVHPATILTVLLGMLSAALFWKLRQRQAPPDDGDPAPSRRLEHNLTRTLYIRDIMSRQLATLSPDDNAKRAWRRLQEHKIKTLPVMENGRVVGIIALVDFLKHLGLAWHTLPEDLTERAKLVMDQDVATLMSKPVHTVSDAMPLTELATLLSDTGLRHLPVVDADGKLVGIVTQSDMIAGLTHLLATHLRRND